ncbi:MAG TPA: indole-3-glycerol phosphate synthase TrpC [Chryseobacterium sp.]|nr:indole-3-glycerol phosphate synthase TrpC [Chryseobacterium sp.]
MDILKKIIAHKRLEVQQAKRTFEYRKFLETDAAQQDPLSFTDGVQNKHGIIAEFKRQSPSKGIINAKAAVAETVEGYERGGASAISVLTDSAFFGGSANDLLKAVQAVRIPVLRKDFMVDEYQFYETRGLGASAVLLIAACLSPAQVQEFTDLAHSLQLQVLLELHSAEELGHVCKEIDMVGVNNRNLKNFKVDLQHSVDLAAALPADAIKVAESGIRSAEDYHYLKENGFNGFLIGTRFMESDAPAEAFANFVKTL